jgi:lipoate-protein ligase B
LPVAARHAISAPVSEIPPEIEWRTSDALVPYGEALAFMDERAAAIRDGSARECVWLLEHPPLFTAGTSADPAELINPQAFPVFDAGRGGRYTYHGPGQRVAYVMLDLEKRGKDIRRFVHSLEGWMIDALAGQLALIRLALGPSITVGGAIAHGLKRLGIYIVSGILIMIALVVAAIPFILVLAALGIPIEESMKPSGIVAILALLYLAIVLFVGVRMIMSGPVASAEAVGPITILKRSWALTDGNFWRLFAFIFAFFIAAIIVLLAIGAAVGVTVGVTAGRIEPMSGSALIVALVQALLNAIITTVFAVMIARLYVQANGGAEAQASVPKSGI